MISDRGDPKTIPENQRSKIRLFPLLLNGFATIQIVWVYLLHTPSALNLPDFENGVERTPFQYRLLMTFPLRWAHHSPYMTGAASALRNIHGWFPAHLSAEAIVQFSVDLLCLASTGLVARKLYEASSRTRILSPFIYPLTLILAVSTYAFSSTHAIRFVYDFPALAFFSVGLYLIYFRCHAAWLALLFVIATLNRETILFLLPIYAVTQCVAHSSQRHSLPGKLFMADRATVDWHRLRAPSTLLLTLPLAALWIAWRIWLVHHFSANPTASGPRPLLNLGLLVCPPSWPQVASTCGFLCPLVFACRGGIQDATLRLWLWLFPVWLGFMCFFGLLIEPRIFGELIPLVACASALIAEQTILRRAALADAARSQRVLPFRTSRLS